jgi:TetR/AcrR family transcriptional repressor of mexJK operon
VEDFVQTNVGRPKDLEKHKQILLAAKNMFLKYGYHGSSMNQIAQEAGVTKLTIYNHFQDKASLFTCAIEQTCEHLMATRPFELNADSDFLTTFAQACQIALNIIYLPEAIKLEHLLIELAAEQNPLALQFYNASHQKMCDGWEDFFQQAAALGFIQAADVEQQRLLLLSLLLGLRHLEVLLGVRPIPNATQQSEIIQQSIELFMLKYAA